MDAACPKHMEFGPCGGVGSDGSCEVGAFRCVFLDAPTVRWHGEVQRPPLIDSAAAMRAALQTRQVVVADFPARALDAASITECGRILAGSVDAVLTGDAPDARVQYPPAYRAGLVRAAGLDVWSGFTCRDRNRVAMEGELAALAHAGVAGVHCVTGDHTAIGTRGDAMPVFDLDSTRAAALARASGHLVSVAESPASPPVERRAARLVEKARAGAEVCFVDHAGGVAPVAAFVAEARALGAELAFIPCVPVIVDHGSAALLATFPAMALPPRYLDRILAARNPMEEGVAAAIELAEAFLAIPGVRGVNLSGGPTGGREAEFAEALARIGRGLVS
jgi:5,10-methylenetetrahydrofolate reductase